MIGNNKMLIPWTNKTKIIREYLQKIITYSPELKVIRVDNKMFNVLLSDVPDILKGSFKEKIPFRDCLIERR
jgi:hypothetical protein